MFNTNILLSEASTAQLKPVQEALKALGYYDDAIDGIFGKNTAHGFAEWKADNYLLHTDAIGPASYKQLTEQAKQTIGNIDWNDFSSKVSQYFTVGEVSLWKKDRIVTNKTHQKNVIRLATELDKVRDWWGSGLKVTSWYRPPHVEKTIGGSGANHPFGYAVDITPVKGSVITLQQRFQKEWYEAGKWNGGFGKGSRKGFIHLDLRSKRMWNY